MTQHDDYDSPWKDILSTYFKQFLTFFFPKIADEIDWAKGYISLDKELRQVTRNAKIGGRLADKLFQVWTKSGEEKWVLVHVEIQAQWKKDFSQITYVYNYRIYDMYKRPVVSLAVFADENPKWRPSVYHSKLWGCNTVFRFPVIKILDYRNRIKALEESDNPFAIVVLAHLRNLETKKDSQRRWQWKVELVRELYRRGFSESDVRNLFHFIDWLLALPEELENTFYQEIIKFEEKHKMRFINIAERTGLDKGELIGEILLAQRITGGQNYLRDELRSKDIDELKSIFAEIENKLNISYEH